MRPSGRACEEHAVGRRARATGRAAGGPGIVAAVAHVETPSALRSARVAVGAIFLVHGAVVGNFATRIPWLRDRLDLGPGALGIALLLPALGAMLAMPLAGSLVHRFSGRAATRILLSAWCLTLALPALAPSLAVLCLLLAIYGAAGGMADVAMNTQAVQIEDGYGRSIMSGLHGMWSIGGFVGSGIGVLAAHAGVDARVHLAVVALVLLAIGQIAAARLPEAPAAVHADAEEPPRFARPSRAVLLIGLVGFGAAFGEGAATDWSAVYLRDVVHSSAAIAAAAYSAYAATMAAGRLAGDAIVRRLGVVRAVRISGLVAAAGALLVVVARAPAPAIAGFSLIGIGVAVVVPLAFAAGGRAAAQPGHGIAGVATIAYGSGLAAPGIIGGIADLSSLSASFAVVAALSVLVTVGAAALQPAEAERTPEL
jgi:MFS family permease